MNAERLQILRMVQEGKVSPEEAAKLLDVVGEPDSKDGARQKPKNVRVVIVEGRRTQTVTVGVGMVKWLLTLPAMILPFGGADARHREALLDAIAGGTIGKVFEVEEGNSRVEVWLEA